MAEVKYSAVHITLAALCTRVPDRSVTVAIKIVDQIPEMKTDNNQERESNGENQE